MKKVSIAVYALFGTASLLLGAGAILFPVSLVSEAAQSGEFRHIIKEQGAGAVFIGLMAFWCIAQYERRRAVHLFITLFTFLLAVIHWIDYLEGEKPLMSGLVNSIPFLVMAALAIPLLRPSGPVAQA